MAGVLIVMAFAGLVAVAIGLVRLMYIDSKDEREDLEDLADGDMIEVGTYAWAVRQLEEGLKVRRRLWMDMRSQGDGQYIDYITRNLLEKRDVVRYCRAGSVEFIPYMVFECDIVATDWEIVA